MFIILYRIQAEILSRNPLQVFIAEKEVLNVSSINNNTENTTANNNTNTNHNTSNGNGNTSTTTTDTNTNDTTTTNTTINDTSNTTTTNDTTTNDTTNDTNTTTPTTSNTTNTKNFYSTQNFPITTTNEFQIILDQYIIRIRQFLHTTIIQNKTIGRIVIPDLSDLLLIFHSKFYYSHTSSSNNSVEGLINLLMKFLLKIKQMIRNYRICIILGVHSSFLPSSTSTTGPLNNSYSLGNQSNNTNNISCFLTPLVAIIDNYFFIDSFIGKSHIIPYEFRDFQGFFYIYKLACQGSLSSFRPLQNKYGLKRDHRKLHIEPLHLPPEDNRATATSVQQDITNMNKLNSKTTVVSASESLPQQQPSQSFSINRVKGNIEYENMTMIGNNNSNNIGNNNRYNSNTNINSTSSRIVSNDIYNTSSNTTTTMLTDTTSTTNTTTNNNTNTDPDPVTRISRLAAKFAQSASHVPKGSSISISHISHQHKNRLINASDNLCTPGNNTNNNDGRLDF